MKYTIDLKEACLDSCSLSDKFHLSVFLLDAIKDYADMYMDDGDDEQYRKLLVVRNRLEHALSILDPVILLICNFILFAML